MKAIACFAKLDLCFSKKVTVRLLVQAYAHRVLGKPEVAARVASLFMLSHERHPSVIVLWGAAQCRSSPKICHRGWKKAEAHMVGPRQVEKS